MLTIYFNSDGSLQRIGFDNKPEVIFYSSCLKHKGKAKKGTRKVFLDTKKLKKVLKCVSHKEEYILEEQNIENIKRLMTKKQLKMWKERW